MFLALVLDAVAIAGQVIVGRGLGAGDADGAYAAAWRMIGWSVVVGGVFALDGTLIGAGDTRFLKWSIVFCSLGVFIPIALVTLEADWGIVGVWAGLVALMVARLATTGARFLGRSWAVTGATARA